MFRLTVILLFCLIISGKTKAQDIIYTTDAWKINALVSEINEQTIYFTHTAIHSKDSIPVTSVYLIHYANGSTQTFSQLEENTSNTKKAKTAFISKTPYRVCWNGLALYNSDLSIMLERHLRTSEYSLGVLAAYNLNKSVSWPNLWLAPLPDAKKQFDAGAYILVRPGGLDPKQRYSLFAGAMLKYTFFTFKKEVTNTVYINGTKSITSQFVKTDGSQLAALIITGYDIQLSPSCFFRGVLGIGGFRLKGDYHKTFNNALSNGRSVEDKSNINFLPKLYLGVCIGWQL